MTNKDKLLTAVYLCGTEKQALMQKAKELGMKGLSNVQHAFSGGAPAIGNRFKNLGHGILQGTRDTGNLLGRMMGHKDPLFSEGVQGAGKAYGMGKQITPMAMVGGALLNIANGAQKGLNSYEDKLRAEGSASGAASAQKGMKDQVDQNGYMRNLMNAIMNKPLGQ